MADKAEIITYEALRNIQRNERKSERLVELKDNFYASVASYLKRKGPQDDASMIELRNAKSILKDIVDRRERKVLNQALLAARTNMKAEVNAMTSKEQELFDELVKTMKKHRTPENEKEWQSIAKKVEKMPKRKKKEDVEEEGIEKEKTEADKKEKQEELQRSEKESTEELEETVSYIKVKILENLPEIVGSDFESYGPFSKDDVVEIPKENADIFIEKNKAELV